MNSRSYFSYLFVDLMTRRKRKHFRPTVVQVAYGLQERVLAYFGPPKIFHTDNGREFTNELLETIMQRWNGNVVLVRVRSSRCAYLQYTELFFAECYG